VLVVGVNFSMVVARLVAAAGGMFIIPLALIS
jgi:hypothetical protein